MLRRVLLVEDHDSLRRLLGKFLSDNFEVVGAKNGLEAMSWLNKGVIPDVIITDSDMPEIDGAELIRQLRCTGLWANIPVVVLAETDDDVREAQHFKSLGAQHFMAKPFNPLDLQDTLLQLANREHM
jgi:two-component system, chemotaxis family, chemotaxis protein CheY